ncbi:MAG: histidine phosphatase family protein [Chloroflexi bacterium]|nr:histidine phosphatase family protein [Chloroflexota bacterium]
MPDTYPHVPASEWQLNAEGRRRCGPLAHRLKAHQPASLYTSTESKARDTAALLGQSLNVTPKALSGLEEHHRDNEPFVDSPDQFHESISRFFENPDRLVYGEETANQALERFDAAVRRAVEEAQNPNVIVVCHGTVISLFLARHTGIDPMDIWPRLSLPSFAILKIPEYDLLDIVTDIT